MFYFSVDCIKMRSMHCPSNPNIGIGFDGGPNPPSYGKLLLPNKSRRVFFPGFQNLAVRADYFHRSDFVYQV